MTSKKKKTSTKNLNIVVNRKFVLDFARSIYNPSTRKYLRLCPGTLQNGPDPIDKKRSMHCGLGEFYFAMTGHHPKKDGVTEDDVIDLAVRLSTFSTPEELLNSIKKLKLNPKVHNVLASAVLAASDQIEDLTDEFQTALNTVPEENDIDVVAADYSCDGSGTCDLTREAIAEYKARAIRVAQVFRNAASFLPA